MLYDLDVARANSLVVGTAVNAEVAPGSSDGGLVRCRYVIELDGGGAALNRSNALNLWLIHCRSRELGACKRSERTLREEHIDAAPLFQLEKPSESHPQRRAHRSYKCLWKLLWLSIRVGVDEVLHMAQALFKPPSVGTTESS